MRNKFLKWLFKRQIKSRIKHYSDKRLNDYYVQLHRYKNRGIYPQEYYYLALSVVLKEKQKRNDKSIKSKTRVCGSR